MSQDENRHLPLLVRREIEARMAVPLVQAFSKALGRKKAFEIAGQVIEEQALKAGRSLAESLGDNSLNGFARTVLLMFGQGGALEYRVTRQTEDELFMDVSRCRYADMYQSLGLEDFGFLLSCSRDFALARGFNPNILLTRTKTIMQGHGTCDFRFKMVSQPSHEP